MCTAEDAGTACQYESFTGCLCYTTLPGTFAPCQKVDPTCTAATAPPPADPGAGGFSAKIALPPIEGCSCINTSWMCNFRP